MDICSHYQNLWLHLQYQQKRTHQTTSIIILYRPNLCSHINSYNPNQGHLPPPPESSERANPISLLPLLLRITVPLLSSMPPFFFSFWSLLAAIAGIYEERSELSSRIRGGTQPQVHFKLKTNPLFLTMPYGKKNLTKPPILKTLSLQAPVPHW